MQLSLCLISLIIADTLGFNFILFFPALLFHFLLFEIFFLKEKLSKLLNIKYKNIFT